MSPRFAWSLVLPLLLAFGPPPPDGGGAAPQEARGQPPVPYPLESLPGTLEERVRAVVEFRQGAGAVGAAEKAQRAFAFKFKQWRDSDLGDGRTLRVCFLGGNPKLRKDIARVASEWSRHCNINFDFGQNAPDDDPRVHQGRDDFEIHITFRPDLRSGDACWSLVGREAKTEIASPGGPTMAFPNYDQEDVLPPWDYFRYYVLHEFGHALGLEHEHQKHRRTCQLDLDKVVAYYGKRSDKEILRKQFEEINYFDRILPGPGEPESFDPKSIMNYPLPAEWFRDPGAGDCAVTWNFEPSDADKKAVEALYGRPGQLAQGAAAETDAQINALIELLDTDNLTPEVRLALQRRLRAYAIPAAPGH
jgi:hypothetical protein